MKPIESILVVLDRSDRDEHVCAKASLLARLLGARIELFLCDSEKALAFKQSFDRRTVDQARNACVVESSAYLASVRDRLAADRSRVTTSAWCESPLSDAIRRKVTEAKPDLVLKSPDCNHPGCRFSFSDNDWHLASTCPAPIMFVRGGRWSDAPRIGAAIDSSSDRGISLAREIASLASQIHSRAHGDLEIVSCVPAGIAAPGRAAHSQRLDQALSQMPLSREAVYLLEGEPEQVLPRFSAERRYELLVMGALARPSGIAPAVGSLTGRLIADLGCDFILVKAQPDVR